MQILFAYSVADSSLSGKDAEDIMLEAILFQRVKFVDLLLMNGFVLRNFLTVERLEILYNDGVRLVFVHH